MAIKKYYIGSVGPLFFDDTELVNDPDGDFAGETFKSFLTDGQSKITEIPSDAQNIVRLTDMDGRVLSSKVVADIDNPDTELNAISGAIGTILVAYDNTAGLDQAIIYLYDSAGPAVNSPYVVDALGTGSERWVAVAGKYSAIDFHLSGLTASRLIAGDASKGLESVDLADWIASSTSQISVSDLGTGKVQLLFATPIKLATQANITSGNYTQAAADGSISFVGTARIDWTRIIASTVTLNVGSSSDTVDDLKYQGDGNFYAIQEAAATPAINLYVNFVSIVAFSWVNVLAVYDGSSTHSIAIQLYNWTYSRWDTFNALQTGQEDVSTANGYILENYSFFVPSDTDYIGTGGSAGQVIVRFYHTMAGNASHDLYIDVVALYK